MYKTYSEFKEALKRENSEAIAKNLFRYHSIVDDIRNTFWRTTRFQICDEIISIDYYKGELQGITSK